MGGNVAEIRRIAEIVDSDCDTDSEDEEQCQICGQSTTEDMALKYGDTSNMCTCRATVAAAPVETYAVGGHVNCCGADQRCDVCDGGFDGGWIGSTSGPSGIVCLSCADSLV